MIFYVVFFDRNPNESYTKFHEDFVGGERIFKWWHYIKSSYLIGTDMTARELSDHYKRCANAAGISRHHLVMKVDMKERQGWLPRKAWNWIQENAQI